MSGLATSLSDARRLVKGDGVRLGDDKLSDADAPMPPPPASGVVLRVGKAKAARIVAS